MNSTEICIPIMSYLETFRKFFLKRKYHVYERKIIIIRSIANVIRVMGHHKRRHTCTCTYCNMMTTHDVHFNSSIHVVLYIHNIIIIQYIQISCTCELCELMVVQTIDPCEEPIGVSTTWMCKKNMYYTHTCTCMYIILNIHYN